MLLYNVTVGVDKEIAYEWLQWMKSEHMLDVLNTGMFKTAKIYQILHETDEPTISYSVQYFAENLNDVEKYLEEFAPKLREESNKKFPNRFAAFRTLLQEV
ncbi:MAG: DUF4286 family protein [Cyclobacteriaceae bacterium]|jgi:hypothetical protein|nr:DUF4286 family protein [Cyclobacteriaceae bacterium]